MKTVVLISCSKEKNTTKKGPIPADELYSSSLFVKSYNYAKSLKPSAIYILSAKHHVLAPTDKIEYYDMYLGHFKKNELKQWSDEVLKELKAKKLDFSDTKFIILAGKHYYQYLINREDGIQNYDLPLEGLGIGERLRELIK